MEPHGKVLLAIGVLGTILILAFSGQINGSKHGVSAAPPSPTVAVSTSTPMPTATIAPAPTPSPPAPVVINRQDCTVIRGSDYRSDEERSWFKANCG